MSDQASDTGGTTAAGDADKKEDPAKTAEDAKRTHEGNAHDDYVETGEESREAVQKWGTNSPGSNQIPGTGTSPDSSETDTLPNGS